MEKKNNKILTINLYIKCLKNNTISTITTLDKQTLTTISAGHVGFKGGKRSTRFAAQELFKQIKNFLITKKIYNINLFINGFGKGRTAIIKSLKHPFLHFKKIIEITKKQHNGCRLKKKKRI